MENMKLSNWMMLEWLPRDVMAEKYTVGQDLIAEQAGEIVRIIARSVEFKLDQPHARKKLGSVGTPYRDFVVCMVLLMLAGKPNDRWTKPLWCSMDAGVQKACNQVMTSKLMYK